MFDFNQLTWFLYFADILSSLKEILFAASLCFIGVVNFGYFTYLMSANKLPDFKLYFLVSIPSFVVLLFTSLIPSETTMYRMAASEAGEMVVQDEYTQEILDDLKDVIKYQLKSLKGE